MASLEIEGLEEFQSLVQEMSLDVSDKRKAVRAGIKVIGKGLEDDTPKGKTGKLQKVKITVREKDLATEGIARSSAFYDVFQDFGTSQQKKHVGYFERSVKNNEADAVEEVAKSIFSRLV